MYYEKQLESREIFSGRVIRVTLDSVELSDGRVTTREVIHHNGGAAIIAVNENGEVALVRQYRYALSRELLEIPAGKIDPGEAPLHAAKRELLEETGLEAMEWLEFGKVIPTCGYCSELIHLFVASKLTSRERRLDSDEFLDMLWMPLSEAAALAQSGKIEDSKTAVGLLRAAYLF